MIVTDEQVEGLADAIMWAKQIVTHNCRGKIEIESLKTFIRVFDPDYYFKGESCEDPREH